MPQKSKKSLHAFLLKTVRKKYTSQSDKYQRATLSITYLWLWVFHKLSA